MHTNNKYFFLLFIFCGLTIFIATAETIDGSSGVSYQTNHYVFNDASLPHQVTGFVRFTNGFTVTPQASASSILNFNGNVLVSGAIDFFKQKTAYEMIWLLEFRRVLFRSIAPGTFVGRIGHGPWLDRDQRRCRGQ